MKFLVTGRICVSVYFSGLQAALCNGKTFLRSGSSHFLCENIPFAAAKEIKNKQKQTSNAQALALAYM